MNHAAFIRTIATALLCATLGSAALALQAPNPARTTPTDDPICTHMQCPIEGRPISQHLPDDQPMLVAPGCPGCFWGTQSPGQSLPEPILVAPTGCGNSCGAKSPLTASERQQNGEPILVAPDCTSVKCRLFNVGEAIVPTPASVQPKLPAPLLVAPSGGCGTRCGKLAPQSLPEPILVAPRGCGGGGCTSPMAASERLQNGESILVAPSCSKGGCMGPLSRAADPMPEGSDATPAPLLVAPSGGCGNRCGAKLPPQSLPEPVLVAPNCPSGCGMLGRQMTPFDGPILVAPDCSSVKCRSGIPTADAHAPSTVAGGDPPTVVDIFWPTRRA